MSTFHYFRPNQCPICSGEAKGCRQSKATGNLFCRSRRDTGLNGWGWISTDRNGFGIYRDQTQTAEQKEQAAIALASHRRRGIEKRAGLLSNAERDRHYRSISRHSGLGMTSRAELQRRGLTDKQIDFAHAQGWISDWVPGSCGNLGLNGAIAGVNPKTGKLCGVKGLAIFAADVDGNITGAQIRPDSEKTREDFAKYLWASSESKGGNGPQLGSGNLPLFVFRHPSFDPSLPCQAEAAEGSLKPLIHALKLWDERKTQTIVIGAASGLFAGLDEVLGQLPNLEAFTLHADAGSQANPDFRRKYPQAIAQVPAGVDAAIGWWGQADKDQHLDIDELKQEQRANIRLISVNDWLALGVSQRPSWTEVLETDRKLGEILGLNKPKLSCSNNKVISREQWQQTEAGQRFSQDKAEAEEQIEAAKLDRFRVITEKIQAELNGLNIAPTIQVSGDFIKPGMLNLPEQAGVIIVQAPTNSRKTSVALKGLVEQHRKMYPNAHRSLWGPRNILMLQGGQVLGLPHHRHGGYQQEFSSCLESIGSYSLDSMPDAPSLVMFDEPSQSFHQNLEGQTSKQLQPLVINRFRQLLKAVGDRKGWLVICEADITNLELEILADSGLPVVEYFKFEKTNRPSREIEVYDSPSVTWDEIDTRIGGSALLAAGGQAQNLIIASDSQRWAEETHRKLADEGIDNIWRIDSTTSQEDWAIAFALNPKQWIADNKPEVLIYTPSLGTGVSIQDDGWFHAQAFHITHLGPKEAMQLIDRYRGTAPAFGYITESAKVDDDVFSSCRPDVIRRDVLRNIEGSRKLLDFDRWAAGERGDDAGDLIAQVERIKAEKDDRSSDIGWLLHHWSRYKARENYAKLAIRDGLIEIWQKRGYNVSLMQLGKVEHQAELRKNIREALDLEEAEARAGLTNEARQMLVKDARQLLQGNNKTTLEQRRTALQCLLDDKLPDCPIDNPDWLLKVAIENKGAYLKQTELLWLAQNPELAKKLDQWTWLNKTEAAKNSKLSIIAHRLPTRAAQAKLLHDCPLLPFVEGQVLEWSADTPEAIAVHDWAFLHRRQFKRYLRLTISEDHSPVKTVNKLLRKLGYECELSRQVGPRGAQTDFYEIANRNEVEREQILEALTKRFDLKQQRRENEKSRLSASVTTTCIDKTPMRVIVTDPIPPPPIWPPDLVDQWATALQNCQSWADVQRTTAIIPQEQRQGLWDALGKGHPARQHVSKLQKQEVA